MFLLTERLIHAKRFSSVAKVGLELVVIPRPQPASSGITDTSHHICGFASLEADFDVSELCIGSSCFSMNSVWRVHSRTFILKYIKTKSQSIKTGSCFYTCKKHASCIPTNTHPGHCNKREALPLLFIHCKRKGCLDYRDQGTAMVSNPRVLDIVIPIVNWKGFISALETGLWGIFRGIGFPGAGVASGCMHLMGVWGSNWDSLQDWCTLWTAKPARHPLCTLIVLSKSILCFSELRLKLSPPLFFALLSPLLTPSSIVFVLWSSCCLLLWISFHHSLHGGPYACPSCFLTPILSFICWRSKLFALYNTYILAFDIIPTL